MGIQNREIGQASSIENNLLWNILKQLKRLTEVIFSSLSGKENITNPATVLADAATIDLSTTNNTLSSSSATRTFEISYLGDDTTIEVILGTTTATYTFPSNSLGVSEGVASGDNTVTLNGASGDHYIIAIKSINGTYYVVAKNFGQ